MCFACAAGDVLTASWNGLAHRSAARRPARFVASGTASDTCIYFGGPILTMDDAMPRAEAVLVRDGRIAALGSVDDVLAQQDGTARLFDLRGRALLPGFFDPHGHLVLVGLQALSANLLPPPDGEGRSIPDLVRIVRAWVEANGDFIARYGFILGFGYDDSQLAERRHPTRDELDAISSTVPVYLIHQSAHFGACNTAALDLAGLGAGSPDPTGGVIRRRPDGSPDGVLEETAHNAVLGLLLKRLDADAALAQIEAGARAYASFGYTTAQEAALWNPLLPVAAERGLLPIDLLVYPAVMSFPDALAAHEPTQAYRDRLRVGGIKLIADGSPQGKTAWLTRPYHVAPPGHGPDYAGYPATPVARIEAAVADAFAAGHQVLCHCNGDAAADAYIAAIAKATAAHGPADRRPVVIHGQTLRADQLDAMKALGIVPALFPMHTFYWGDWHRDSVLGPERAQNISPTGWCLERGMRFTSHHDAPVARPDSMRVLSATVNRRTRSGAVLGPHQRVSVETALKAMTLWPAWQHFEDADKGSIEPGKRADFVILSDNPTTVPPLDLAAITIEETIKDGETIYRR